MENADSAASGRDDARPQPGVRGREAAVTGGTVARRAVTLAVVAAVLGAGGVLLHSGAALAEGVQVWRGFYTVAVSSDSPELVRRLEEAGLGPVLAAAGARELVTTFRGYEPVSVADLDVRLDRLDPRYDPYLQAVGKWFAAGPGGRQARIVYVASALPAASFAACAARALAGSGVRWEIAGLPWRSLALALLLYVAAAAALIVPRGGAAPRRWRVVLGLPWLFLVAQGGLPAAFVAVPAQVAAVRLAGFAARRGAAASLRPAGPGRAVFTARAVLCGGLVAAAAAAAAALASATPAGALVATMARYLAIGSLWSAALAACAAVARALPPRMPPAPRPSAAGAGTVPPALGSPLAARLCVAAALASTAAALVLPAAGGAHVPRPDPPAAGVPVTLAAMAWFSAGAEPRLPVLVDHVTHLAYQQTLAVGRPYRLPAPDERVTVDHYRRTADGRVVREQREVARFTEQWLADALAGAPAGSVASLLAAQGSLVAARRGPPAPRSAGEVALWIALVLLLCVWTIDPLPASRRRAAASGGDFEAGAEGDTL